MDRVERVVVCLHVGENTVTKVWRFDTNRIAEYTRQIVEDDLVSLFPDIARKKLKLKMWYVDDLAGEVSSSIVHEWLTVQLDVFHSWY